jgi:hypothetical protein
MFGRAVLESDASTDRGHAGRRSQPGTRSAWAEPWDGRHRNGLAYSSTLTMSILRERTQGRRRGAGAGFSAGGLLTASLRTGLAGRPRIRLSMSTSGGFVSCERLLDAFEW